MNQITETRLRSELQQLQRPVDTWPHYPFLPVKKAFDSDRTPGDFPKMGVLYAGDFRAGSYSVYDANVWALNGMTEAEFRAKLMEAYVTLEEMILDGWVVD